MRSPPPGRDRLGWNYMSAEWVLETFFQRVAGWTYDYSQTLIDVFLLMCCDWMGLPYVTLDILLNKKVVAGDQGSPRFNIYIYIFKTYIW